MVKFLDFALLPLSLAMVALWSSCGIPTYDTIAIVVSMAQNLHDPHTIQVGSCHVQQQRPHGSPNAPPVSHCRLLTGRDQTPSSDLIVGSLSSQIPGTLLSPLRSGIWKFGSTYHIRQPASKNTFTVLRRLGISLAPQYNSNSTPLHPQPPANTVGTLNPHKYSQRDKTSKK